MKFKQFAVFAVMALFASTVWSGEQGHHKMKIKIVTDDGDGETHMVLDSDDMDVKLHDMQVGENQSIVDKEGRTILVTRSEDGFTFDVDGKTIEMPALHRDTGENIWISKGDSESDIDVRVMGDHMPPHRMIDMKGEGVMIISGKEIDAATQQVIRSALETAGHDSVHFSGGPGSRPHEVRVIKKVVEVSD